VDEVAEADVAGDALDVTGGAVVAVAAAEAGQEAAVAVADGKPAAGEDEADVGEEPGKTSNVGHEVPVDVAGVGVGVRVGVGVGLSVGAAVAAGCEASGVDAVAAAVTNSGLIAHEEAACPWAALTETPTM
jgi:hypothetical protein